MSDYPQDGTTCCSHDPEPGQEVTKRCPECKHFMTFIYTETPEDGAFNCTWPDCPTNEGLGNDNRD